MNTSLLNKGFMPHRITDVIPILAISGARKRWMEGRREAYIERTQKEEEGRIELFRQLGRKWEIVTIMEWETERRKFRTRQ